MSKSDRLDLSNYSKHNTKKQYVVIGANAVSNEISNEIRSNKWLLEVGKLPMIKHILDNASDLHVDVIVTVFSEDKDIVLKSLRDRKEHIKMSDYKIRYKNIFVNTCVQDNCDKTKNVDLHDLLEKNLISSRDSVLVLSMVSPLLTKQTMQYMFHAASTTLTKAVILGKTSTREIDNGRIILDQTYGTFIRIVDQKECSDYEKRVSLVDTGIYAFKTKYFIEYLKHISSSFISSEKNNGMINRANSIKCLKYIKDTTECFSPDTIEVVTSHVTEFDETLCMSMEECPESKLSKQLEDLQTEYYKKFVVECIDKSTTNMSNSNLTRLVRILDQLSPPKTKSPLGDLEETKLNKIRKHIYSISNTPTNKKYLLIIRYEEMIIGTGSILIEDKIIHDMGIVGHIEDIVVDEKYRGLGLANTLMYKLIEIAKSCGCYKIILDASDDVKVFYEKLGFKVHSNSMRMNL